jgi:predicted AlkP superfamily phosphohydrolase/phosphomutase
MPTPSPRVLVLGLDGGTFDLFDPWIRRGEFPFLSSLMERGFRAPLRSVFPAKTIPAWYSFATGQDPGALGIFGFTEPNGGPGKSRIVQTFRPAEAVWDRLSRRGHTVGVLNFPVRSGYPINGFVIPGMLSENPPTYPGRLRAELEECTGEAHVPELPAYREADRAAWIGRATRAVDQYARYAEILCERYRPEFLFTLLRETDRVEHQHWAELTRPFPEVGADLKEFWRTVDRTCQRIDTAFRRTGGPVTTLVISDHGHGSVRSEFFTNRWLAQEGYLRFRQPRAGRRRRLMAKVLLAAERFGPTRRLVRTVSDRVRTSGAPGYVGRFLSGGGSFEAMAPEIDWTATRAFSYPVPEGIYLNRYGPPLAPDERHRLVAEIRAKLEAFPGARIEVFEPAEIYRGNNLSQAPALFLRIDDLATESRMDFSYPEPMLGHRPSFFYGTGVHRMDGILIAAGDGVAAGRRGGPFSLLDVAPTILEKMGCPEVPGLSGRSFVAALGGPIATLEGGSPKAL